MLLPVHLAHLHEWWSGALFPLVCAERVAKLHAIYAHHALSLVASHRHLHLHLLELLHVSHHHVLLIAYLHLVLSLLALGEAHHRGWLLESSHRPHLILLHLLLREAVESLGAHVRCHVLRHEARPEVHLRIHVHHVLLGLHSLDVVQLILERVEIGHLGLLRLSLAHLKDKDLLLLHHRIHPLHVHILALDLCLRLLHRCRAVLHLAVLEDLDAGCVQSVHLRRGNHAWLRSRRAVLV